MPLSPFIFHPTVTFVRRAQLVVAIIIYLYAALSSGPDIPSAYPDWALHFIGNVLLFGSLWAATLLSFRIRTQLLISLPFSVIIELSQLFSQGRHVDLKDMLVNFVGLGFAALFCWGIERYGLSTRLKRD